MSLRSRIVEPGDAAATADNIRASEALLRADIAIGLGVAGHMDSLTSR